jgi:YbgC/YbaW family acyl-CoA thioester hydrolase
MFTHQVTVQLHHTDAYGIIFFANQFILCHGCWQAWLEQAGIPLAPDRASVQELCVIVRAESDYQAPIRLGDKLTIAYGCEKIGTTSIINVFILTNQAGVAVGRVRTTHVMIDPVTSAKKPLPERWRQALAANMLPVVFAR